MATTIPDISVTSAVWLDLNTASGIVAGTEMYIVNKSGYALYLYEGPTPPVTTSKDGVPLTENNKPYATAIIDAGSDTIWARCAVSGRSCRVTIQ